MIPLQVVDIAVCVAAFGCAYAIYVYSTSKTRRLPYPPGPTGLPIIGITQLPARPWCKTYRQLGYDYNSEIIRVPLFGSNIIVLNSLRVATDLLDKRSTIYSDRPQSGMTMVKDLVGFGWSFVLQSYGSEWRDGRKAFQHAFHPQTVAKYRSAELRASHALLKNLLKNPDSFFSQLRLFFGRVILDIGYGIEAQNEDDPFLQVAEHACKGANASLIPGAYLVDVLPFLRHVPEWFPGAGFQRQAKIWRKSVMEMLNGPFDFVKNLMAESDSPDCATKSLIEDVVYKAKDQAYMEKVVKSALGSMYGAGTETGTAVMQTFVLAMVRNPEIQRAAQDAIDKVCHGRLPDFSDYDLLPHVHAIVLETMRWNSASPLNMPHRLTKDDIYDGYFIPAGSIVLANNWAILRDPELYEDPDTFNPNRFLTTDTEGNVMLDKSAPDPSDAAFGFGRRACPGRYMAYEAQWIAFASVLACFDLQKAKDENGDEITPECAFDDGFTSYPKPFKCSISPRTSEHRSLILSAMTERE